MPLTVACRGGALLRTVRPNVLCRSARVAAIHTPAKRVSLAPTGRLSKPPVGVAYPSSIQRILIKSYATAGEAEGSSEKSTSEQEASQTTKRGKKKATSATKKAKKSKQPKKPKKKVLTPRQKLVRAARERRERIKHLKEAALQPPKPRVELLQGLLIRDVYANSREDPNRTRGLSLTEAQAIAKTYSQEEREKYARLAMENRVANAEDYRNFINSHTPLQIREANLARRSLSRLTKKKHLPLKDDRLVKNVGAPHNHYYRELKAAGELEGLDAKESVELVNQRYRELTAEQKQKYVEMHAQDRERFERECMEVYGKRPQPRRNRKDPKAETS